MGTIEEGFLMKADFDHLFKSNTKLYEIRVPNFVVDHLSESLCDNNLKYVQEENGVLLIVPNNKKQMKISGLHFSLTNEQKEILGHNPSVDKILRFSYNSQQPIKLTNQNKIMLNDKEVDINKFAVEPFSTSKTNGFFSIIPDIFPKYESIVLKNQNHSYEMKITRVPNNDPYEEKFISNTDKVLSLIMYFNNKTKETRMKFDIHFDIPSTFKEIIDCAYVYNGLIDNTTTINGNNFPKERKENINKISPSAINLWEKATKIEKKLGKNFKVCARLNKEETILILKLYKSLIKHEPFCVPMKLKSINLSEPNVEEMNKVINNDICLQYDHIDIINLFGEQIDLFNTTCVYHVMIISIEKESNEYKVKFNNFPNKKSSMVKMYFIDEKERNNFKNKYDVRKEFLKYANSDSLD